MNRRNVFALAFVLSSLSAVGCAAGNEPSEELAVDESSEALITVGSSSGGTSGGTISTRPSETLSSCISTCKQTRTSNGWCTAYCECKVLYNKGTSYCAEHASTYYIDI